MKSIVLKKLKKHEYLIQTWPDKMFQSTVVNRTLTGPLKTLIYATFRPPPLTLAYF